MALNKALHLNLNLLVLSTLSHQRMNSLTTQLCLNDLSHKWKNKLFSLLNAGSSEAQIPMFHTQSLPLGTERKQAARRVRQLREQA